MMKVCTSFYVPSMATDQDLWSPVSLSDPRSYCSSSCSPAFFVILKHAKLFFPVRPLYLLFPLPGIPYPAFQKYPMCSCLHHKMLIEDQLCSWHCRRHRGYSSERDKSLLLLSICPSSWHLFSFRRSFLIIEIMLMLFIFFSSYLFCLFLLVYHLFERKHLLFLFITVLQEHGMIPETIVFRRYLFKELVKMHGDNE